MARGSLTTNPLDTRPGPEGATCAGCVWRWQGGRGRAVERCRKHTNQRVRTDWPACVGFEGELDCLDCGACCREAYHRVEVSPRDPFVARHPDRVSQDEGRLVVTRHDAWCGCLDGTGGRYTCVVYDDRPDTCRAFLRGGPHCLEARRRLRISR